MGQRIQEQRKKMGLSQEALGEALGVSRQAISKWEGELVEGWSYTLDGVDYGGLCRLTLWVTPKHYTKGDSAAVGDSDNDLGMLRVVGHPIAMGNAKDSIKALACRVVGDNNHDGVAEAILSCLAL